MGTAEAVLIPMDTGKEEATMGPDRSTMRKVADLMKLDAKGISPPALISIMQGQLHTALQYPGMIALVARRRERMRRLTDEIKNPGMHIKQEKPPAGAAPMDAAAGPPGMMPMAPGSPIPPSNHLGMFPPGGVPGAPAGGMPGAPAGAGMVQAAAILKSFAKRAIGRPEPEATPTDDKKAEQVRAFKYGFFHKVAECGMLPKEFEERAVKHAAVYIPDPTKPAREGASWLVRKAKGLATGGLIAPFALGLPILFGLGMAGRHLTKPEYETPDELRSIEQVALYKRLGREARMRASRLQKRRKLKLESRGEKVKEPEVEVPKIKRAA